jgi:hypothetical protein
MMILLQKLLKNFLKDINRLTILPMPNSLVVSSLKEKALLFPLLYQFLFF